tara:strand:- start:794 stop:1180 length:387 start_codon:yes stop_codon:yes gene_type:complete
MEEKLIKVSFTLKNNSGVTTFGWDAVGKISDEKQLVAAMVDQIKWMQSKALRMKDTNQKIGLVSATNLIHFGAAVYGDIWQDYKLEDVSAKLKNIRLCTKSKEGWVAGNHHLHVETVVEAATRQSKLG